MFGAGCRDQVIIAHEIVPTRSDTILAGLFEAAIEAPESPDVLITDPSRVYRKTMESRTIMQIPASRRQTTRTSASTGRFGKDSPFHPGSRTGLIPQLMRPHGAWARTPALLRRTLIGLAALLCAYVCFQCLSTDRRCRRDLWLLRSLVWHVMDMLHKRVECVVGNSIVIRLSSADWPEFGEEPAWAGCVLET